MRDSGILYIVFGVNALAECKNSIDSVRENMPGVPIAVIADEKLKECFQLEVDQKIFVPMPSKWDWKVKVDNIRKTPFEKTLFLDTDTIVCEDVTNLFTILDRIDIALCHDTLRTWGYELPNLPDPFSMLNSGVIVFKNSDSTQKLFELWCRAHDMLDKEKEKGDNIKYGDQNSLRYALYFSTDIKIFVLPSEYNCRVSAGYVVGRVKIIHAHTNLHVINRILNSSMGPRLHGTIAGRVFFVIEKRRVRISNPLRRIFKKS